MAVEQPTGFTLQWLVKNIRHVSAYMKHIHIQGTNMEFSGRSMSSSTLMKSAFFLALYPHPHILAVVIHAIGLRSIFGLRWR